MNSEEKKKWDTVYYVTTAGMHMDTGEKVTPNETVTTKAIVHQQPPSGNHLANKFATEEESHSVFELCTEFFKTREPLHLFGMTLEEIQMQAIFEAVVKCNYNCAQAARRLGVCDKTVYTKINKYKERLCRKKRSE